ncbi:hypothetical protein T10_6915 [Trichinella papuae]|uniref:DUF5641 domain-containing protein n=1 Tax=Trichinella papuae TaxID=268474 RepID=A0A0V1MTC2_9BILA|nr:hypothetical protein T10_6915 [Trichinella papuae]
MITELFPGSDGIARSARIRTSTNVVTRPVAKLVPLEPAMVNNGRGAPPSGGGCRRRKRGFCRQHERT